MLTAIEIEVGHALLPVTLNLRRYERLQVRSRVKDCESSIDKLRRDQESREFDNNHPERYSLTSLPNLVGVRILTFGTPL